MTHRPRAAAFAGAIPEFPTLAPPAPRTPEMEVADAVATAMWRSLALHDELTAAHSSRVAQRAVALATCCGMTAADRWVLRRGALLHDIGKLRVPDALLNKPAHLDVAERTIINQHPEDGGTLIDAVFPLRAIRDLVLFHHERWDGQGYPRGLVGAAIPFGARVLAVCDTYDAMTTDRPYRGGVGHERAIAEITRGAGAQFDPAVVEVFVATTDPH